MVSSSFQGIDRISPTRRPDRPVVGRQSWRQLLFAHWPIDQAALRAIVPRSLEIDTFEGQAFIGIVPLVMRAIRPASLPPQLGLNFLETNLRTYVHVAGRDPGVYFFSLDASSRLAVEVARRQAGLPYYFARMRMRRHQGQIEVAHQRLGGQQPRFQARYHPGEWLGPSPPGTLEHFLLERYLLHVERQGSLWTMQVHHTPYPAQRATVSALREELVASVGLPPVNGLPPIAHFAAGVDVEIFGPWRTRPEAWERR